MTILVFSKVAYSRGFIFRALSVARRGYTAMLRQLFPHYSSYTVIAFRVQVENGSLENVFFLHFSLVSIQFDIS